MSLYDSEHIIAYVYIAFGILILIKAHSLLVQQKYRRCCTVIWVLLWLIFIVVFVYDLIQERRLGCLV